MRGAVRFSLQLSPDVLCSAVSWSFKSLNDEVEQFFDALLSLSHDSEVSQAEIGRWA